MKEYVKIKKFVNHLESKELTCDIKYDDGNTFFQPSIYIIVNNEITITYSNNTMVINIKHKDALIKVFNDYLSILRTYDQTLLDQDILNEEL